MLGIVALIDSYPIVLDRDILRAARKGVSSVLGAFRDVHEIATHADAAKEVASQPRPR